MSSRLTLVLAVFISLVVVAPAQAAPGALNILVTSNGDIESNVADAIEAEAGVASTSSFGTNSGTPSAADLAQFDLVVSLGDSDYLDAPLWGDRLADYIDAGGSVLQAAYDNWDSLGAWPSGRFASGNYAPLLLGDNVNTSVTLGTIVEPSHPIMQGLEPFGSTLNTDTALAPGATLLAKWSDDRNAIAVKGRVVATSAAVYPEEVEAVTAVARLAVNAGNYFNPITSRNLTISKSGTGAGTVTSTPAGILCGTTCSSAFLIGSTPTLTATAAPDSQFKGWTGACAGIGACVPTIAASDLAVGAVFDLAGFGPKTRVALSATSTKIAKNGRLKIRVRNTNGFSVSGTVKVAKLKSKKVAVKASGRKTVTITLSRSLRKTLVKKGKLKLTVTAKIKSPSGTTRKVKKKLTLKPKR